MSRKAKIVIIASIVMVFAIGMIIGSLIIPRAEAPEPEPAAPVQKSEEVLVVVPKQPRPPRPTEPVAASSPVSPTLCLEKWVKLENSCCWEKTITAEKGDALIFKLEVRVTGTLNNVLVKDSSLVGDPWVMVDDLKVDNVPYSGNIVEGINLGSLTNETKTITFRVWLCGQTSQYICGQVNVLINEAEVSAECSFQATSLVEIKVYGGDCSGDGGDYSPPSSRPPRPSPPPCPDPAPPPPPPGPDDGDGCDPEPPPSPPDNGGDSGPAPRPA